MSVTSEARAIEAGRTGRLFWRFGTGDLLWGRLVPAFVFQLMFLNSLSSLTQRFAAGPGTATTLAFGLAIFQQTVGMIFGASFVILFVVRRPVVGRHSSLLGAVVALAGTFIINVPVGAHAVKDSPLVLLLSSVLMLAGMAWSVASIAYLGRCFGILPEARGLVTRGPYHWVRHPLYLGELTAAFGWVIATLSPALCALFLVVCGLQYWRILMEEDALSRVFPEYRDYARRTSRILPGIH